MKKMKTKRFLSLLLALAMSFSMAMPASAATLYNNPTVYNQSSSIFKSDRFTSTPGNGQYIKVWYANRSEHKATVYLYRIDQADPVATKEIAANTHKDVAIWYDFPDTKPVTFYVKIVEQGGNPIKGYLSVAQKPCEGL